MRRQCNNMPVSQLRHNTYRVCCCLVCLRTDMPSMYHNNGAASFAACCSMQLLAASWALPLLWAPALLSCRLKCNGLLAFTLCALHEYQTQLMASRLSRSLSSTEGVTQDPLRKLLTAPTEDLEGSARHWIQYLAACMQQALFLVQLSPYLPQLP